MMQVNEVRQQIGPQSGNLAIYCTDASIARYLRARNWNVKKAVKMLKATLKWRLEYKPEEIRWVILLSFYLVGGNIPRLFTHFNFNTMS